jgi:hypothetical protein
MGEQSGRGWPYAPFLKAINLRGACQRMPLCCGSTPVSSSDIAAFRHPDLLIVGFVVVLLISNLIGQDLPA